MNQAPLVNIRPMRLSDIPKVLRIEHASFHSPWSEDSFRAELRDPELAYPIVAEDHQGTFCGYAIFHHIIDEIHLVNIAVAPEQRRKGYADKLVRAVLHLGEALGGRYFTLEVRATNHSAQALYLKHGFNAIAIRKGYYQDQNEDALVMVLEGKPGANLSDVLLEPSLAKIPGE